MGRKFVETLTTAGDELPAMFVAVILNVYAVFTVNPVNVQVLVDAFVVANKLPGDPVILYPVIGSPPLKVGTSHAIVELITSSTTDVLNVALIGGYATVGVVIVIVSGDDTPIEFIAIILNVYVVVGNKSANTYVVVDAFVSANKLPGDPVIL